MHNKYILIIEDSYTSVILMKEAMDKEGCNTQIAYGVKEAIPLIKEHMPNLIILDLNMPEVSGFDFLKMRKELKIKSIPIIVVSALNSPDIIARTKELGAADFFPKPVNLNLLYEKIKSLF